MNSDKLILDEGLYDSHNFKAIFICGSSGSGKTTIERELGLRSLGLKSLDVDKTAAFLHAINDYAHAGSTSKKILDIWVKNHLGLILNRTGREADRIIKLNKKLEENYYNTFMLFVDVNEEIAQQRLTTRYQTATEPEDIGRKVELDYFKQAYPIVEKNIEIYKLLFGRNFALVHNNEEFDEREFDAARRKLNNFLTAPLSKEAQNMLAGIKPNPSEGLGRKYVRQRRVMA